MFIRLPRIYRIFVTGWLTESLAFYSMYPLFITFNQFAVEIAVEFTVYHIILIT